MSGEILRRSLRDQRRALAGWSVGIVAFAGIVLAAYPSVESTEGIEELMESYPPALKALFGAFDDFRTPAGFFRSEIFSFMGPLLVLIYAIGRGTHAIAGEEEGRTLDLLLSFPVTRRAVVLEKAAAAGTGTLVLVLALGIVLGAGALAMDLDIALANVAAVSVMLLLLGLAFGALALALGATTGRRGLSTGVAAGIAAGTYLVNGLAPVATFLEPLQKLTPFYYYSDADPLVNGLNAWHALVLAGLTLVFVAWALWAFERRDVGV